MPKLFSIALLSLLFVVPSVSQSFSIDEKLPSQVLDDTTRITFVNARFGSRFSFSPSFQDLGVHTGSMGFDLDELTELLISLETDEGVYCFRTSGLPFGARYLKNQTIKMGMTSLQLTGETEGGTKVTTTIISPFTPSDNIDDEENIKIQIVPAFYIITDIMSYDGGPVKGNLRVGFKKFPVAETNDFTLRYWAWERNTTQLFFADNTRRENKMALAAITDKNQRHFSIQGYNGLETRFDLKSGSSFTDTLVYAVHHGGTVLFDRKYNTSLSFFYNKYWDNVFEVLDFARSNAGHVLQLSQSFENIITRSGIDPMEKWVVALSFRSDLANTFFLRDEKGNPRFYVSEGRFRHLNTVDVAHETELMAIFAPWRLKLQLETWTDYIARKEVLVSETWLDGRLVQHREGMSAAEYGPFIYHDVGDQPYVSAQSDYQFGPHMAVEENTNFPLMLYWYWKLTGDDAFVRSHLGTVDVLLYSVLNRDTSGSGLVDQGFGWTTYDKSDAIKRAPENVYLGVKQMAAYLVAADMFENLYVPYRKPTGEYRTDIEDGLGAAFPDDGYSMPGNETLRRRQAAKYRGEALHIVKTLQNAYEKYGYLPVSLDETFPGWDQHSVVLGEGLFLPGLSGFTSEIVDEVVPILKSSYEKAFEKSKTFYGITLSSDEPDTWFSKIMVSDMVAWHWYGINQSTAHYAFDWNVNNYFAYNDGVESDNEGGFRRWTGFWYPRGVSSLGYLFREKGFIATERESFLKEIR
jgi:hypothetical protein